MKYLILYYLLFGVLFVCVDVVLVECYLFSVCSCECEVMFECVLLCVVSYDINFIEMMVVFGLQMCMVGYIGISGWWKNVDFGLIVVFKLLFELVVCYFMVEILFDVDVDFFFVGWGYGMCVGGDFILVSLELLGVKVYELSEFCVQIGELCCVSFDELYCDLCNLGWIFDVELCVECLVVSFQVCIECVCVGILVNIEVLWVFFYDSGEDCFFIFGCLGMLQVLIEVVGGCSVIDDVVVSWIQVNWESVVVCDLQVIVIVDYGEISVVQKQCFFEENLVLCSLIVICE